MELLQFVFSSFWVWLGCVVLIVAAGEAVATAAAGFRQKRKVSVYHVGDVTRVEVENAGRADIPAAVKALNEQAAKVLSICKTNGLYYLYDRIDRSGEITQWLGDGYALYPLDGLPILDEESFCAVFDITGKQREKILFRHERLPEHLNVEDVAAGDKLVREYETTFINGGLRLKPLKTNNGVTFIRSLYLSPLEDVIDMVQFYERTTPQGGSYIVAKAGFLTAAVIMPYVISKKFADELEELSYQCRHFLNTRSAFTTPAAEDEEEPDENQTTTFDAEAAEDTE